jgi:membrane fusion protein (multidrug efflux system)
MSPVDPNAKLHPVHPEEVTPPPANAPDTAPPRAKRRLLPWIAALVVLAGGAGVGAHVYLTRGEEGTDDAAVEADVVALAPRVAGSIAQVLVEDNAHVVAGQPLFRIDDADYQAKVRQADAELATARAQVLAAQAQVGSARATVSKSEAEAAKAELDLKRADALKQGDAIATQSYEATRTQDQTARAGVGANRAQYAAALANLELAKARVQSAQAAADLARLQASYTVIKAPADGVVSRFAARVGQIVQAGQNLGQLVPDRTYIVANLKETQTGAIRPGQRVDVTLDAYPGRTLSGTVESVSAGTGARFALLPPDNASGNFVKVVERVPVRIAWSAPPADLPLRAGLSAYVTVYTR